MEKFFGKYRGKIINTVDPLMLGRVQVSVPSVLGDGKLSWAMPCVPYAGKMVGFFAVPPAGSNIWVEFEGGDIDHPIWSGCFWGTGEIPVKPAVEQMKVFKTQSVTLTLNDMPGAGGFKIEVNPPGVSIPLSMEFNSSGIEISCSPANFKMTPASIEMDMDPSSFKMTPANIEAGTKPAVLKISPASVEMGNPPGTVKITPASVEATNGPAAFKMQGPKVDVNNGALEVI